LAAARSAWRSGEVFGRTSGRSCIPTCRDPQREHRYGHC
jgi:hypothetical protein